MTTPASATTTAAVPTERRVELASGRFRYLEWGDDALPTVLLLHGRTSLVETWLDVAEALALEGWHVLALEQRGHGQSPWNAAGHYNLAEFLGDLEEFVDAVIPGRFALIGHSMGSCTSMVYASRHADRLVGVVLEDGGPVGPTVEQAVADDLDTSPASFATWADARTHIGASHQHYGSAALDRRTDLSVRPGDGGHYYWVNDVRALLSRDHFDDALDSGLWEATEKISTDTIFLWASAPHLVEPEVIDRMVEINPHIAKITFPTGHSIHEEAPSLFLAEVVPFLEKHRSELQ